MDVRSGKAKVGALDIVYEDMGDVSAEPMLLIMGLSAPLTMWPDGFCAALIAKGYRVIRFDNRDVGLSSKFVSATPLPSRLKLAMRAMLGWPTPVPYTLPDMARDAAGVLDALGIPRAHVVGASMGGMIAQIFAATYPDRVASLGIIMSSTNQPFLPGPALPIMRAMRELQKKQDAGIPPALSDTVNIMQLIGSPGYPISDAESEAAIRHIFARAPSDPIAVRRQSAAIFGTGDLRNWTRAIKAPTVVIHGDADPLVRPKAGKSVATNIANARLELIPGMGHNLPAPLWPRIVENLHANAAAAS